MDLTTTEKGELQRHEQVIERGLKTFVDVGSALMAIRDSRLYREKYSTFEDYCRERWGFTRQSANRYIGAAEAVRNIEMEPIGSILPQTESQARPLTSLPPEQQREAWQAAVETAPNGKITARHVADTVEIFKNPKPPAHVSHNSGNNEWYTPREYIQAARDVMGDIDTDPASSEIANRTVNARIFYTADEDGLAYDWRGRVWMNPPYAQPLITEFCEKLAGDYRQGFVYEACALVNNATETKWFNSLLEEAAAVCFIRGRVKFIDPAGNPSGAPLQGQAVLYLGENPEKFSSVFSEFGAVLYAR